MPVPAGLRQAVAAAVVRATANPWLRPSRQVAYRERITAAVMAGVEPVVSQALTQAADEATDRIQSHGTRMVAQMELEYAAGYRQGHQAALLEAATMLKRHGHRSAVTRLLALADEELKTPARPRPVNASPAGGPGLSAPEGDVVAPEPTEPENGAQRGVQPLTETYLRNAQHRTETHGG